MRFEPAESVSVQLELRVGGSKQCCTRHPWVQRDNDAKAQLDLSVMVVMCYNLLKPL